MVQEYRVLRIMEEVMDPNQLKRMSYKNIISPQNLLQTLSLTQNFAKNKQLARKILERIEASD